MKKKHHHKRKHRNNGGGGASAPAHRPRPRPAHAARLPRRGPAPDWKTVGAAIIGGAGGAALGGLIVNQRILSPEAVGLGLMLGGGATAFWSEGTARVVGTSIAAAGAGQLALAVMAHQAVKSVANHNTQQATSQSGQPAAQLPAPPPPVQSPRQGAHGGGVVVDVFRDAATDMDMIEDELRFGMRDDLRDAAEPFVIDFDEVA